MDATAQLTQLIGGLPDAVFLQRDAAAVASLPSQAALAGLQGVVIGAPRRVDIKAGQGFSALVLVGRTPSRSRELPWQDNAVLLATDVDRGQSFAAQAFPPDPSKSPPDQPRASKPQPQVAAPAPAPASPIPPPPEASNAGTAWVDLSEVLSLPRRTMRLALRLVYFDQLSNAVLVEQVGEGAPAGPTPMAEVQTVFARLAAAGQSVHRLPLFTRHAATPAAPREPGIALALGPVGPPGAPVPLHVALRLELTLPMTIDPVRLQGQASVAFVKNGPPKAVVRAAVLLLRRNSNQPYLVPIEFPLWSERDLHVGETVGAAFSVDLAALLPAAALEDAAQVYVLAGRHVAGPAALGR